MLLCKWCEHHMMTTCDTLLLIFCLHRKLKATLCLWVCVNASKDLNVWSFARILYLSQYLINKTWLSSKQRPVVADTLTCGTQIFFCTSELVREKENERGESDLSLHLNTTGYTLAYINHRLQVVFDRVKLNLKGGSVNEYMLLCVPPHSVLSGLWMR